MIFGADHVRSDRVLEADLCVVGSGAGGAPVAAEAVAAGKSVVVLEAGRFWRPKDFTQLEHEMFPRLFHEKGGRATRDKAVKVHQGKGVGGSTLHNINLCKPLPMAILRHWKAEHGLEALDEATATALFDEVETRLGVTTLTDNDLNHNNRVLKEGAEALGYPGGFLRHNRTGCMGSGFCELGCPFDAKNNALKVFIADAVAGGATVLADTWAVRVTLDGRRATGVEAVVRHPDTGATLHRVTVKAKAVCVSASATATPSLLRRSGVDDPGALIGSRLHLHPGTAVAAVFDRDLDSWQGIPQSWECTELLDLEDESKDLRCWLIAAFAHPAGVGSILAGFGADHARWMKDFKRIAAISPMVHDHTVGRVDPRGDFGVSIDYWPDEADRAQLRRGLVEGARILLAAGAARVVVPLSTPVEVTSADEVDRLIGSIPIERHDIDITAVHPMSSVWMGDDPATSCCDSRGRYHHADNLFVADTSLYPTSIGIPPQITTYAMGLHVGRAIVATL